jgi:hypothetical protein
LTTHAQQTTITVGVFSQKKKGRWSRLSGQLYVACGVCSC